MKKTLAICVVILMLIAMSVSVFANPGSFDESPSGKPGPDLIEGDNESEACTSVVIVTAYGDRDELSADDRIEIESAYTSIVGAPAVTSLNGDVAAVAEEKGVAAAALAVSDLFEVSATGCESHDDHGTYRIVLDSETLNKFVCLLKFENGAWTIVESAEITTEEGYLEFTDKTLGTYAIVVSTGDAPVAPAPDNGFPWWIVVVAASVGAGGFFVVFF